MIGSTWTMPSKAKAESSCAIAVVDNIEGRKEDTCVGPKFAASVWIYTKAVACNGPGNMQEYRVLKLRSINGGSELGVRECLARPFLGI